MLAPLIFASGDAFERFLIRIIKIFRQLLLPIIALFEFGLGHSGHLSEVAITIQNLMHLIFDLCLQIEVFQQFGYRLLNFMRGRVARHLFRVLSIWFDELVLK